MTQDRIEDAEQLVHAGDKRHFTLRARQLQVRQERSRTDDTTTQTVRPTGQMLGRVRTHPQAPTVVLPGRDALGRVLHPIKVPTVSAEKREWLRTRHSDHLAAQPRLAELRERLIALAGGEACFADREPDLEAILERGQVFSGRCRLIRGERNQCHANAGKLWENSRGQLPIAIVTGYALSDDGLWRQHSWLIAKPGRRWTVIETTCRRLLYYGVVLTEEEARHHADCNPY
jgi:hypothetical protein